MIWKILGLIVMFPGGVAMVYLGEALGHNMKFSMLPLISFFGGAALMALPHFI